MKIPYTQIKHIKLHEIAADVKFKNRFNELKRSVPVQEWKSLQRVVNELYGLTEDSAPTDQQIEDLLMKAAKELKASGKLEKDMPTDIDVKKLEKGDESGISESKKKLNELGIVATAILAAPTVLELLGKFVEWTYRKIVMTDDEEAQWKKDSEALKAVKKTGKLPDGTKVSEGDIHVMEKKLLSTKAGKVIMKVAHGLHDLYISPLRLIIAGIRYLATDASWLTCWKESKTLANKLYTVIMFAVVGNALYHMVPMLMSVTGLSTAALTTIGTGVLDITKGGKLTSDLLKTVLGYVHL
jgi:hypothetical protein